MDKKKIAIIVCAIVAIIAVTVGVIFALKNGEKNPSGNNGSGDKIVVKKVDDWEFDGTTGTRDGLFNSITNSIAGGFSQNVSMESMAMDSASANLGFSVGGNCCKSNSRLTTAEAVMQPLPEALRRISHPMRVPKGQEEIYFLNLSGKRMELNKERKKFRSLFLFSLGIRAGRSGSSFFYIRKENSPCKHFSRLSQASSPSSTAIFYGEFP